MLRKEILAILRCCECGADLSAVDESELVCDACHARYPVREGVPIMIAGGGRQEDAPPSANRAKPRSGGLIRRLYQSLSPPSAIYVHDKSKITRFVASLGPGARVVDLGSGSKKRAENTINLDIRPFPNVDVVFDGGALPIKDGVVDGAISTAVLEHVPDAEAFVAELYRILKPGGQFLVTVPFMEGFHTAPHDYRRYTLPGLEALFHQFDKVESGLEGGPSSALAWMLREWIAVFGDRPKVYYTLKWIGGWLVQPIKYFDLLLNKKRNAFKIAAGYYYIGRKP